MITTIRPATAIRAEVPCPEHPDHALMPYASGAARGMCPETGRSFQMDPPEFKAVVS